MTAPRDGLPATDLPALVSAGADDVHDIWLLRRQLEDWLAARSIRQWPVGELPEADIADQVSQGLWYVLRCGTGVDGEDLGLPRVIAALRLQTRDPDFWPEDPRESVFVHGLMVDRCYAGRGLGGRMLAWATVHAAQLGATWLRLDCAADNAALRAHYRSLGFREVRDQEVNGRFTVTLMCREVLAVTVVP